MELSLGEPEGLVTDPWSAMRHPHGQLLRERMHGGAWMGLAAWLEPLPCPLTSSLGMHPLPALIYLSALQTLCEQLRKENEALKAKLDKGLEQRDQAAERLR